MRGVFLHNVLSIITAVSASSNSPPNLSSSSFVVFIQQNMHSVHIIGVTYAVYMYGYVQYKVHVPATYCSQKQNAGSVESVYFFTNPDLDPDP
jgi:hypothetical protein